MDLRAVRYMGRARLLHDLVVSAVCLLVAFPLVTWLRGWPGVPLELRQQLGLLAVIAPIWALVFRLVRSDQPMRTRARWHQVGVVVRSVTLGVGLLAAFLYLTRLVEVPRSVLVAFFGLNLVVGVASRLAIHEILRVARARGQNTKQIVIVGTTRRARRMADLFADHPEWGLKVVGLLGRNGLGRALVGKEVHGMPVLGTVEDLLKVLREVVVDEVVFAVPEIELDQVEEALKVCEMMGVQARLMMDFADPPVARVAVDKLGSIPMISFSATAEGSLGMAVKGMFDSVGALALIVVLSPVLLACAVAVRLSSPGPILFRQKRCGLNGREFVMFKFRSMVDGADDMKTSLAEYNEADGPVFKIEDDPRVTRVGRFLRRMSLDELPQLFNVLKGEMSLVGPRPPLQCEVESYEDWQLRRLSMRPGLTGLWQVSGRSTTGFGEWIKLDLQYIDRWSLALDLKILALTIPAVLSGRGAY